MKAMKRWLPVLCVAVVAVGITVRLRSGSGERQEAAARKGAVVNSPSGSSVTPANGTGVAALQERLLIDDRLAPPPPGASAEELAAYQSALEAIQSGQDPLKTQPAQKAPPVPQEAIQKRLEARRKMAEDRRKKVLEEREKIDAEIKKAREASGFRFDPNRPPPPPLVPPPNLGPAVVETPR